MDGYILPEFHLPTEIYIKQSISRKTSEIVSKFGSRIVIVVTTADFELYHESLSEIYRTLKSSGLGCIIYDQIPASPTTEDIDLAVSFIKKTRCDLIIGFGGVDSLNCSKAVSLLLSNFIFCYDIFDTRERLNTPVNFITMPAYPSFGFEISPMFYIKEIHNNTMKTYHNTSLYPKSTIVDPDLSLKASENRILMTSTSSLAMATESVISTMNNDIMNIYALKSIDLIFRNRLYIEEQGGSHYA